MYISLPSLTPVLGLVCIKYVSKMQPAPNPTLAVWLIWFQMSLTLLRLHRNNFLFTDSDPEVQTEDIIITSALLVGVLHLISAFALEVFRCIIFFNYRKNKK